MKYFFRFVSAKSQNFHGEQAQEIYNETIASLKDQVDSAQEALDETKEQIAEYQALVEGDDYYNTYIGNC